MPRLLEVTPVSPGGRTSEGEKGSHTPINISHTITSGIHASTIRNHTLFNQKSHII